MNASGAGPRLRLEGEGRDRILHRDQSKPECQIHYALKLRTMLISAFMYHLKPIMIAVHGYNGVLSHILEE